MPLTPRPPLPCAGEGESPGVSLVNISETVWLQDSSPSPVRGRGGRGVRGFSGGGARGIPGLRVTPDTSTSPTRHRNAELIAAEVGLAAAPAEADSGGTEAGIVGSGADTVGTAGSEGIGDTAAGTAGSGGIAGTGA